MGIHEHLQMKILPKHSNTKIFQKFRLSVEIGRQRIVILQDQENSSLLKKNDSLINILPIKI